MGYRLTLEAEADIIDIARAGLRMFGKQQAARYHDALFDLLDLIAANPKMARERPEITPPVRIMPYKAHLVVYVIDENEDVIVVRVRHGHENLVID